MENTPPRITSIEIANAPSDNSVGIDAELNFVAFSRPQMMKSQ